MRFILAIVTFFVFTILINKYAVSDPTVPEVIMDMPFEDKIPAIDLPKKQLNCLVLNAYHEARGEGDKGMVAVTQVVLNRVEKREKTPCAVIFEHAQFSWTLKPYKQVPFQDRKHIEQLIIDTIIGNVKHPFDMKDVIYYHANYVKPAWAKHFKVAGKIKNHIFYKET